MTNTGIREALSFTATTYGQTMTGTCNALGWTADSATETVLSAMAPAQRRRAELRCKRAASKAHELACRS